MKSITRNKMQAINARSRLLLKTLPLLAGLLYISSPVQAATQHIVESGETLSNIASRYQVTQTALIDSNGLMAINIQVGQILTIPDKDKRHNLHRVQSGDSLNSLSRKYKVASNELARANNLSMQSALLPNGTLIIPAKNIRSK